MFDDHLRYGVTRGRVGLIFQHQVYDALDSNDEEWQKRYRALVRPRIPDLTLEEIRAATNKA